MATFRIIKRLMFGQRHHRCRLNCVKSDAVMLKGAVVTRRATKVVLKEDTFIYNASAYKTPEGATLEELVKRLPGATIGDDGKINYQRKRSN